MGVSSISSSIVLKPIETVSRSELDARGWEALEREQDNGRPDPDRVSLNGEPVEYAFRLPQRMPGAASDPSPAVIASRVTT